MAPLPVITGEQHPILRKRAAKVKKVTKEILKLLKDMRETAKEKDGAGLAAPQVGESLSICLAMLTGKMTVLINPRILRRGKKTDIQDEGCLSLPGLTVAVERSLDVTVRFLDEKGKEQERRLVDFDARVAQHEIDHLEGRLIVDYLPTLTTRTRVQGQDASSPHVTVA